ncbi:neogenin-like isoform X2 [Tigriopus californicus]|uniref:neogenin-like isoform X2 n=1 Tax=Tigriopus californicus TaxID=6832 RepID=UPI0027DA3B39|nr:neogenin-like isoform X2 [Tigriopus californicus]
MGTSPKHRVRSIYRKRHPILNLDEGCTMRVPIILLILATLKCSWISCQGMFPEFRFLDEPEDTLVVKNQPATLKCSAVGPRPPKIRWKRNGEFLQFPDFNDRRRLQSDGSLYFSTIYHKRSSQPDEGLYQCVASVDGLGTIVSRMASLQVSELTRFETEPEDQTVFLGQTAVFQCSMTSLDHTDLEIVWLKDDQNLFLDHRMKILPSGMLAIADIRISDRAEYRCNASNEETWKLSQIGHLRLNLDMVLSNTPVPPMFIARPKNLKAEEGQTLTLDCAANGIPKPFITWLKDGSTVDLSHLDSRFTKIGSGSLQIKNVQVNDKGTYQCRAENSEDSVDAGSILEVRVKPRFIRTPQSTAAVVKDDIELECEVYGVPNPVVQWYKKGDLIIESEYFQIVRGSNLKILGLVELDSGFYQCMASNPIGNVQASAQLLVKPQDSKSYNNHGFTSNHLRTPSASQPDQKSRSNLGELVFRDTPSPPTNIRAVIVSARFITLSWTKPAVTNGPLLGFSVYYKERGSNRERVLNSTRGNLEELNVQGLVPGTRYIMRVVAHNEHGAGDSSQPLEVSTQDELDVPGPVSQLTARPTSSFSILISWGKPSYSNTFVTSYKLYYRRDDEMEVKSMTLNSLQYHLTELREYTEYTFWISAFNSNGEGAFSEEIVTRTFSDVPADPPQNVTLEADSSKSLIIRWEPPPKESQNGILTGYKIRWRRKGKGKSDIFTTDGSRRLFAITGLDNGQEYQVKISAITVNGTGPATPWMSERTFDTDLDESVVPNPPNSLKAKAYDSRIEISWTPPRDNKILVRGYTIGWGKGIPDEYTKVVDDKQRDFAIKGLKPNSEYVISLRAYNNIGDGRPIYETIRTSDEIHDEPLSPFSPPIKLHARILSSKTALLTWLDSSLPKNQVIPDHRYYIVRYTSVKTLSTNKPRHEYRNSTDLNVMIDNLRPSTEYEFTVKVVKGRRQSRWSLVALNHTEEAAPGSPPRDLSLRSKSGDPETVVLSWRAPKIPNGQINGYVIHYTIDKRAEDRDWYVKPLLGDHTTTTISNLVPSTKYFFKISARNSKGSGPVSLVASYTTPRGMIGDYSGSESNPANQEISPVILYAVAGVASGIIILVVIGAVFVVLRCTRSNSSAPGPSGQGNKRQNHNGNKPYLNGEIGSQRDKLNPPPPDLWIGHDQLELKAMSDVDPDETGETSIARSTPIDYASGRSMSSIDRGRGYGMAYSDGGTESEVSFSLAGSSICRGVSINKSKRIKGGAAHGSNKSSIKIAAINGKPRVQRYLSHESVASSIPGQPNGAPGSTSSTYIRSQYSLNPPPPLGSPDDLPPPGYAPSDAPSTIEDNSGWGANTTASSIDGGSQMGMANGTCSIAVAPPMLPPTYLSSAMSTSSGDSSSGGSRQSSSNHSQPMKSFSHIIPGANHQHHHHHHQPQPKNIVRPQPTSPFKRPLLSGFASSSSPPGSSDSCSSKADPDGTPMHSGQLPALGLIRSPDILNSLSHQITPSLSTEELREEMKNLEGLMKDLNTISKSSQGTNIHRYPC